MKVLRTIFWLIVGVILLLWPSYREVLEDEVCNGS